MKKLCTICAKKNSKDLKNKNLKKLAGKPLIYHTLKLAIKSKLFDAIIVSSDSKKILNYSRKNGAFISNPPSIFGNKFIIISQTPFPTIISLSLTDNVLDASSAIHF